LTLDWREKEVKESGFCKFERNPSLGGSERSGLVMEDRNLSREREPLCMLCFCTFCRGREGERDRGGERKRLQSRRETFPGDDSLP